MSLNIDANVLVFLSSYNLSNKYSGFSFTSIISKVGNLDKNEA